jgi:hypothetical protein
VQNPAYLRLGLQQLRLSSVALEQLALQIMYFVGRAHLTGGRRWTVNRLATELGLPGIAVAQVTAALEGAGLLIVTDESELAPGRDISRIGLAEILEVARHDRSGHLAPHNVQIPPVDRVLASLDEARRKSLGELTLRDLADEAPLAAALPFTPRQSGPR